MRYGDIHELFQPIFDWIKEHYPSGGFFIVDRNSAKFYAGKEDLSVYDKETVESVQKSISIANTDEAKQAFERFNQRAKANGENTDIFSMFFDKELLKDLANIGEKEK